MNNILEINDLSFQYSETGSRALNGIDLIVKEGEFLGITGPAGAGKSTLLNCINGTIPHHYHGNLEGKVIVNGLDVARSTLWEIGRIVGSVSEDPDYQMIAITVEDEVAFGPENSGLDANEIQMRVQDALDKTDISILKNRDIRNLSGGQKQRVAISAILSMMPSIVLLDEPTSELDPLGAREVFHTLRELNRKSGKTIVVVSQDLEQLAENADRILLLSDGKMICNAPPRLFFLKLATSESVDVRVPEVVQVAIELFSRTNQPLTQDLIPLNTREAVNFIRRLLAGRE